MPHETDICLTEAELVHSTSTHCMELLALSPRNQSTSLSDRQLEQCMFSLQGRLYMQILGNQAFKAQMPTADGIKYCAPQAQLMGRSHIRCALLRGAAW